MTRYIAILTLALALTAALNADQAFAAETQDTYLAPPVNAGYSYAYSHLMLEYEYEMLRDAGFTHTEAESIVWIMSPMAPMDGTELDGFANIGPSQFRAEDRLAVYGRNPKP